MADNLSVNVTADTTKLRAGMALAQQDVKTFGAAMRAAAADIRATGTATAEQIQKLEESSSAYNKATGQVGSYTAQLRKVDSAHESVAGSAGVTREALVMLHETMMGNYKRLAGSTVVLAERTNLLHTAIGALSGPMGIAVGAAAALTGGLVMLAIRAHEVAVALREAGTAAVLMGQSGPQAQADVTAMANSLKETGIVGHAAAYQISSAIQQLPNVMQEQKDKLNALAPVLFEAFGEDAEKTVKEIGEIFASDTSLKSYLDKEHLLTTQQMLAWADSTNSVQKYSIGIDALSARLTPLIGKIQQQRAEADDALAQNMLAVGGLGILPPGTAPELKPYPVGIGDFEPGTKAPDPQAAQDTEAVIKHTANLREQRQLTADLDSATRALAADQAAGDKGAVDRDQAAIKNIQAQLANLKPPGDADWASKIALQAKEAGDKAEVAAYNAHASMRQISESATRAEMAVYKEASEDMSRTDAQRTAAKREYITLEMSLVKEQARGDAASAKEAYAAKVAEFDQEIAAAKGNADQVMALEAQKLAFIKQARGAASAEYQNALRAETNEVKASVDEQVRSIEEAGKRRIKDDTAMLDDEVARRQISKAQEAQQLQDFVKTERDAEIQSLTTLVNSLDQGTAAYTAAFEARKTLDENFATRLKQLQTEMDANTDKSAEKMTQRYTEAFGEIGSTAERAFTSYITYSTTLQKAEQEVARSVLTTFINLGMQMAERWAVTELARLTTSETTQAAINTIQATTDSAGGGRLLADWLQLESAKTAATTTGASTRATADSGGGFLSSIGQMLSRWLGLEAGKTAATTAGAGTRSAADTTAATTGSAAVGVAARANVAAAAAVAAAWAFADSAMTGPEGLAAAPGAASAAEGTVMAFQAAIPSFDVGSTNVTRDMIAQIHKGEIIVPASQAAAIRAGDTTMGSAGGALTYLKADAGPRLTGLAARLVAADTGTTGSLTASVPPSDSGSYNIPPDMRALMPGGTAAQPAAVDSIRAGDTFGGSSINANYAPTFHGSGSDMASQAAREFGDFKSYIWNTFRNGQLRVPGRA